MILIRSFMLASAIALSLSAFAQGGLTDKISLGSNSSLGMSDVKEWKATESIKFRAGFRADAGCYLFASVKHAESLYDHDELPTTDQADKVAIFPNPILKDAQIMGSFTNEQLQIIDAFGNLLDIVSLKGENPIVDMSAFAEGTYYLRIDHQTFRVHKK